MVWEGGGWSGGCEWSGVGEVKDSGADLDTFRLLANIGVLDHIIKQESKENPRQKSK